MREEMLKLILRDSLTKEGEDISLEDLWEALVMAREAIGYEVTMKEVLEWADSKTPEDEIETKEERTVIDLSKMTPEEMDAYFKGHTLKEDEE